MTPRNWLQVHGHHIAWISLGLFAIAAFIGAGGCATARNYSDPDSLRRLIADRSEPYVLVDVRTREEFERGHIPTAINIAVTSISDAPPTSNRNALVIVYCASGMRSASAARRLEALGFVNVVDFGSISRWKGPLDTGGAG